jgi:hypothetical protein
MPEHVVSGDFRVDLFEKVVILISTPACCSWSDLRVLILCVCVCVCMEKACEICFSLRRWSIVRMMMYFVSI